MPTCVWEGNQAVVAQVDTFTPANVEISDVFTLTMGARTVSFTATGATVGNVTAGITAAWNASTDPDIATLTAADATTHVTLTADVAGVPFTVTSSATDGGGTNDQTFTRAASTANQSPNDWSDAENWSTGTVPVDSDVVIIENSNVDILYGLAQSDIQPASLTIKSTYTGKIGLPRYNSIGYAEYLPTYLAIGPTVLTIGDGEGNGSGRIKIDTGTDAVTCHVYKSGTRQETGIPSILLKGTSASNVFRINRGDVGLAFFEDETANAITINVGYVTNQTGDAKLTIGPGLTHAATGVLTLTGGKCFCDSALINAVVRGGELTLDGTATVAALTLRGGTCYYRSSGTATAITAESGGVLDFSTGSAAVTITNATFDSGATVKNPHGRVTWSNVPTFNNCGFTTA